MKKTKKPAKKREYVPTDVERIEDNVAFDEASDDFNYDNGIGVDEDVARDRMKQWWKDRAEERLSEREEMGYVLSKKKLWVVIKDADEIVEVCSDEKVAKRLASQLKRSGYKHRAAQRELTGYFPPDS